MGIRTIRRRIVLAFFLVGCIPLFIGLLLASMSGMRSLRNGIGGNFQAIASQTADRVTMLVDSQVQALRLLASAPLRVRQPVSAANLSYPVHSSIPDVIHQRSRAWEQGTDVSTRLLSSELSRFLVETKVRDDDKVVGLMITDRYGAIVAASSEPDRYFFGNEPWWRDIQSEQSGHVYISDLIPGQHGSFRTPEETIDIAVPIFDDHQRTIIGAIKASYRFDGFFAMIKEIRIGQTGHAMLFDSAGQPLVCPVLPRPAHLIHQQLMAMIVSHEPGWGIAEDDAHGAYDTVVGFAPVRGLGKPNNTWHMFVRQHPSETYAPIREQLWDFTFIGLVMVGLLAAIGRYVAARIAKPIQVLRKGVEAISQGRYDAPLTIKTGDEFEELGTAIHRMADNLKTSRVELEALNQDLTRRIDEKTAEVTRHMRKLDTSERLAALGKMASGIAHEINNPLGIILNRIECIEAEALHAPLPDDLAGDLSAIRKQAERIYRVTHSMLSLSRGTAMTLKPVDVNCVIRSGLAVAGERASSKGITIAADLAETLPPIMGDRVKLETVILNLVNNAIDSVQPLGKQGHIIVQSRGSNQAEGGMVAVTVRDNGPGIPPDAIDHVCEPFFTTKVAGEGNGLGLFLTCGIIAEHRGRLDIANGETGAVFTVHLPALGDGTTTNEESVWESTARS
ncbi:sensor histidine kinase [Nitrospira sp. Nam74]